MTSTDDLIAVLHRYNLTPMALPDDILKQAADRLAEYRDKLLEIQVHLEGSYKALEGGVAYIERLERVVVAAQRMKDQKWSSVEKDNMEFRCITTCFVLDELRDTLKQLDDAS